MTDETRVSLVVGLLFIIMFGLILSEITGKTRRDGAPAGAQGQTGSSPGGDGVRPASARDVTTPPLPSGRRSPTPVPPAEEPVAPPPPLAGPAPAPARPEAAPGAGDVKKHVVRSGETLGRIAAACYGQTNAARGVKLILEANRDRLPNPNRMPVHTELVIPPLR
jgi:nucleoid-associated protein YgaU